MGFNFRWGDFDLHPRQEYARAALWMLCSVSSVTADNSSSTDTDITDGISVNSPPTCTVRPSPSERAHLPRASIFPHVYTHEQRCDNQAPKVRSTLVINDASFKMRRLWQHANRNVYVIKDCDLNLITSAITFDLSVQKEDYLMNTFLALLNFACLPLGCRGLVLFIYVSKCLSGLLHRSWDPG